MSDKKSPRIYFGWWTVLVTSIWSGLGQNFYMLGISVLFKPIAADLGLSRAVASLATGIGRFEGGIESPLVGWLSDKFGPRWVIFVGVIIAGVGMILMNFINSLWSYILVWGILVGFGVNLAFTLANAKFITDWFISKRGLALGTRFVIMGIFGVIILPVMTWLVTTQGWRMTNVIWAIVMFVGLPFLWYMVKQKRPEYYGLLPDGIAVTGDTTDHNQLIEKGVEYASGFKETEFTIRQTMRTRAYWILTMGYAIGTIIQGAVTIHLIPFLTDIGISPVIAGSMMAAMVFFQIPARFVGAFVCDRIRADYWRYMLGGSFLIQAVGIAAFLLHQSIPMLWVFLVTFGIGTGLAILMRLMLEGRYFGRKAFGSVDGSANLFAAPMSFLAPIYTGWVYDTTGNYIAAFITLGIVTAVAGLLCCFAKAPPPPAEVTDVRKFV